MQVRALLREGRFQVASVTEEHAELAIEAYDNYGKGRGRKANLNLGDCFSYALAKATGLPLLFKGNDFTQTDLEVALRPSSLPPQVSLQVFLGEDAPILRLTAPVFLQRLQVVTQTGCPPCARGV
ncbi:MAG: type II toxin-antitoxin system VapC family toxin [Acidobacteria bacterium]|nr:type II toxin-antitoxin system VapC family toxin [Acidobacteriota bacterium]